MTGLEWHNEYPVEVYEEARKWVRDNKAHIIDMMVPEEFRELLKRDLRIEETLPVEPAAVLSDKEDTFWYRPEYMPNAPHWPRYRKFIEDTKVNTEKWPVQSLQDLEYSTTQIVNQLPNPNGEDDFECTGLVVGYVQSGKTANFTGVIAKAVDAGYNMAIVFSGLHNILRKQTQVRLDRELTGLNTKGAHVKQPPASGNNRWNVLTKEYADFYDFFPVNMLQGNQPLLLVMKKNCTVLERLLTWLDGADDELRRNRKVLIIDDEADHGSINIGRKEDLEEAEDDEYYDEIEGDLDQSRTNELIRRIRDQFPKRAYIGYTATPFANVLIDPFIVDSELGETLYPRDFIISLPKPEGYKGTEELFPENHGDVSGRGKLSVVSPSDKEILDSIEEQPFEMHSHSGLPDSLVEAVMDFILTGTVKLIRNVEKHHSMLIHTDTHVHIQTEIFRRINNLWDSWNTRLVNPTLYGKHNELYEKLEERWNRDFYDNETTEKWGVIRKRIPELCQETCIMEINHTTDEELDYDLHKKNGLKVIAIGGTKFSRGLTLEGLTVSYYTRESKAYDTLLQMSRWFGYRPGYYDLVRIYTTARLVDWFGWLALVEEEIRKDIARFDEEGRSPRDLAVRIRTHSAMLVTSPLKMGKHIYFQVGFDGQNPQTVNVHFEKPENLEHNLTKTRNLLYAIEEHQTDRLLWKGVPGEDILRFLSSFKIPEAIQTFDKKQILRYIENRMEVGELNSWSVVLASRNKEPVRRVEIAGHDIGLVNRSRIRFHDTRIGVLSDPQYWCKDLNKLPPEDFEGTPKDWMLEHRDVKNGQLQIYLIDKYSKAWEKDPKKYQALFKEGAERADIVGLVFAFPRSETAERANFVASAEIPHE